MYATRAEPCWAPTSVVRRDCCDMTVPRCERSAEVWALLTEIAAPESDTMGTTPTDLSDELHRVLDEWLAEHPL